MPYGTAALTGIKIEFRLLAQRDSTLFKMNSPSHSWALVATKILKSIMLFMCSMGKKKL